MTATTHTGSLIGAHVYSSDDKKIGRVGQVYDGADGGTPAWVTVRTGLLGASDRFAPLSNAEVTATEVRLAYGKEFVKDSPRIADDGDLSEQDETSLYEYYGNGGVQPTPAPAA